MVENTEREYVVPVTIKTNLWPSEVEEIFKDQVSTVLSENGIEYVSSYVEDE